MLEVTVLAIFENEVPIVSGFFKIQEFYYILVVELEQDFDLFFDQFQVLLPDVLLRYHLYCVFFIWQFLGTSFVDSCKTTDSYFF